MANNIIVLKQRREASQRHRDRHPEYRAKAVKRAQVQVHKNKEAWKTIILEKFGGGCVICGYDKCWTALDLHHVVARKGNKELLMCKMTRIKPTPKRVKELDKCVLLCANCHREVHHAGGNKGKELAGKG